MTRTEPLWPEVRGHEGREGHAGGAGGADVLRTAGAHVPGGARRRGSACP